VTDSNPPSPPNLLERARRARLLRILLVYLGASFAALEAIDLLGDKLALPAWVFSGAVVLLLIGLPIVVATSLIQGSGSVAASDPAGGASPVRRPEVRGTRRLFTWRNAITGGVLAFALWGVATAGWMLFGPNSDVSASGESATEISSLAVLPFADMSPDGSAEYLGDGVAETLIDALTRVEGLRVAARTSAFSFKGKNEDIRTIGEQLNVNAVLEGSVQTAGDRVRITAQLIEVEDGFHLWSQTYDGRLEDVFAVQDEVARSVVSALKLTLAGDSGQVLVESGTENLEAYNAYLLGRHHWNRRTSEDMVAAIAFFEQAIAADSSYAPAWSGLAAAHLLSTPQQYPVEGVTLEQGLERAEWAANRAQVLGGHFAEPHAVLGMVHEARWEWADAEREMHRAVELDPHNPTARFWYASLLAGLGRMREAEAEIRTAHELDPLSLIVNIWLALILDAAGEVYQAEAAFQRTLQLYPSHARLHRDVFSHYLRRGAYEDAARHLRRWIELLDQDPEKARRWSDGILQDETRAGVLLEVADHYDNIRSRRVDLLMMAGEREAALAHVERETMDPATAMSMASMAVYIRDPELRADPSFKAALRRMGLP